MEIMLPLPLLSCAGVLLGVLLSSPMGGADHPNMPAMGCSCPTYHPQNHMCGVADVVFRAVILWKEPTESKSNSSLMGPTLTYSMLTDKIYKKHRKVRKGREILVKTSDSSAMCGVTGLRSNEEYLISGNFMDGELLISLCNFIRPWKRVTAMQKSALKSEYKENCQICNVVQQQNREQRSANDAIFVPLPPSNATNATTPTPTQIATCQHNPQRSAMLDMEDCETEYSACILHPRTGDCAWHMNRKFDKCVAKRDRKTKIVDEKHSIYEPQAITKNRHQGKQDSKVSASKRLKSYMKGKRKGYRY